MRLATLNVFGLSGNWSDRLVVLRNGFSALDADVVTLQETMVRAEVDQAAEILPLTASGSGPVGMSSMT